MLLEQLHTPDDLWNEIKIFCQMRTQEYDRSPICSL